MTDLFRFREYATSEMIILQKTTPLMHSLIDVLLIATFKFNGPLLHSKIILHSPIN